MLQRTAAFLLLAAAALAQEAPRESVQTGEHFRIRCRFANDEVAKLSLEAAEATWAIAASLFGATWKAADAPMDIHLYATIADYQAAEAKLTGGRFKENNGFSDAATKTAHIPIIPPCSPETLRLVGLPALTRRQIAHEAAHLVAYHTMPNANDHPDWLAEGAATWVAQKVLVERKWSAGPESEPFTSDQLSACVRLRSTRGLPSPAEILAAGTKVSKLSIGEQYAVHYAFFDHLQVSHEKEFAAFVRDVRRLGGGANFAKRAAGLLEQRLGKKALDLDAGFDAYAKGLKPEWEETYRALSTRPDGWIQLAFPDWNAIAWRTESAGKPPWRVAGEVEILPGAKHQMNVLLGRSADGFVSVAISAGSVTAFRYDSPKDEWRRLGAESVPAITIGARTKFDVGVSRDALTVRVNGERVLEATLGGRDMSGAYGLGAQNGSAGIWRGVKLEK